MEINHAITVHVHLCLEGAHETWRHGLSDSLLHVLDRILFRDILIVTSRCFMPLLAPDLQSSLILGAHCQVVDAELRVVTHDNTDIVSELLVGDQVIAVTVHLVEGLDDIDRLDSRRDQRPANLVPLEAA